MNSLKVSKQRNDLSVFMLIDLIVRLKNDESHVGSLVGEVDPRGMFTSWGPGLVWTSYSLV